VDFVVAGLGIGALMVVIGFVVRDIGPFIGRQYGTSPAGGTSEERARWRALCHGISNALTLGGGVILVATFIAVLLGLSDSIGGLIVLIASVAGAGFATVSIVKHVTAYRRGIVVESSGIVRRSSNVITRKGSRQLGVEAAPTVRRVVTNKVPEPAGSIPDAGQNVPPPPDEPFDVNRLLPQEFDEESPSQPEVTAKAPFIGEAVEVTPAIEPTGESPTGPSVEPVEAASAAAPAEKPSVANVKPIAELTAGTGAFKSPLLADIGKGTEREPAERQFASSLLADVDSGRDEASTFQSPLLADLASAAKTGPTRAEPSKSKEDEYRSSKGNDEDGDESRAHDSPVGTSLPNKG
jgi:hypothetical protein